MDILVFKAYLTAIYITDQTAFGDLEPPSPPSLPLKNAGYALDNKRMADVLRKEKLVSEPIRLRAWNKPGAATADSCFVLFETLQYGVVENIPLASITMSLFMLRKCNSIQTQHVTSVIDK